MLQDKIRTEAYKDTIYNNSRILKGKKIVDIGAGKFTIRGPRTKTGRNLNNGSVNNYISRHWYFINVRC